MSARIYSSIEGIQSGHLRTGRGVHAPLRWPRSVDQNAGNP